MLVDALFDPDDWIELPDFGGRGTDTLDAVIVAGGQFDHVRTVFAYSTDRLRGEMRVVRGLPPGHLSDDQIARRRWGELIGEDVASADLWKARFSTDSWLRRLLERASTE